LVDRKPFFTLFLLERKKEKALPALFFQRQGKAFREVASSEACARKRN